MFQSEFIDFENQIRDNRTDYPFLEGIIGRFKASLERIASLMVPNVDNPLDAHEAASGEDTERMQRFMQRNHSAGGHFDPPIRTITRTPQDIGNRLSCERNGEIAPKPKCARQRQQEKFKAVEASSPHNSVSLEGFAAEKMETRTAGNGSVTQFQMATNSSRKNATGEYDTFTEWHTLEAWGKTGEYIASKLQKGSQVEGKLEYSSYEKSYGKGKNAQTVKHTRAIIRVNTVRITNKPKGDKE